MRHIILAILLSIFTVSSFAIPARRGQWLMLTLTDGTTVMAEGHGDEHTHWWQSADGKCYVQTSQRGIFRAVEKTTVMNKAKRRGSATRRVMAKIRRRAQEQSAFTGQKKGLIILAEFPNCRLTKGTRAIYDSIANTPNYNKNGFKSSIRDYFKAQSDGKFNLMFDVAGPVMMSHDYAYYGDNGEERATEMIEEACNGVDSDIDFADYDWNGDGEAEEVFVVYAGHGQNDYQQYNDSLIWPHMDALDNYYASFIKDGTRINVYACTSELNGSGNLAGIGTFCHEFSHCMGFPDMYDTGNNGNFGLGSWDLMDYGSYNDDGYTPAGYSGYEKMVCGWTVPVELTDKADVDDMKALSDMGQTYIIYNNGHKDEYYILENRQKTGYDRYLPGHGLLIEHIDYDKKIWDYNVVNTTDNRDCSNDHTRITIFHANGGRNEYNVAYPYYDNDSLTNRSQPAAKVCNANADGSYYMNCAIRGIKENSDGTISFSFSSKDSSKGKSSMSSDSVLFDETFDKCDGEGGNDGIFSGIRGNYYLEPDNDGWSGNDLSYGAYQCARFGTSRFPGEAITPYISLPGDTATLTFRAAGWNTKSEGRSLDVQVYEGNAKIIDGSMQTLNKGQWKNCCVLLTGKGRIRIDFLGDKRFFLDDVKVTVRCKKDDKGGEASAIRDVRISRHSADTIYDLSGRRMPTTFNLLPKGIYIINGKKVIK